MAEPHSKNSPSANVIEHKELKSVQQYHTCTYEGCESFFLTNATLESHMRIHKGEKPFPCRRCNESFITEPALVRHEKNHKEKTYYCHLCTNDFYYCSDLARHLNGHNDEKAHVCLMCTKSFPHIDSLLAHLKLHVLANSSTLLYCHMCGKDYISLSKVYGGSLRVKAFLALNILRRHYKGI